MKTLLKIVWLPLLFSIALAILIHFLGGSELWIKQTIDILPNLVGFSLASLAIFIASGNTDFIRKTVNIKCPHGGSIYMSIITKFVVLILIQLVTILMASLCEIKYGNTSFGVFIGETNYKLSFEVIKFTKFVGLNLFVFSLIYSIYTAWGIIQIAKMVELFYGQNPNKNKLRKMKIIHMENGEIMEKNSDEGCYDTGDTILSFSHEVPTQVVEEYLKGVKH